MTPTKIVQNAITSPLKCGIFLDELMFGNGAQHMRYEFCWGGVDVPAPNQQCRIARRPGWHGECDGPWLQGAPC